MAKFCGKCGSKLDEKSGLCPKCDMKAVIHPMEGKSANTHSSTKRAKRSSGKKPITCVILIIGFAALALLIIFFETRIGPFHIAVSKEQMASQSSTPPAPTKPAQSTEYTVALSPLEESYAKAEALLAEGKNAEAAIAFGKLGDYADARMRSFGLWERITQRETVSAGGNSNVYLKSDGTVSRVVEENCRNRVAQDTSDWRDIVSVSAGNDHTVGLKSDGTVVAAAVLNNWGQSDVSSWSDIVSISAGYTHTVGLRSDGTVVAVGEHNHNGQCDVSGWTGIVAVSAGTRYTVGLKYDGTVVATSFTDEWEQKYYCGQCDVSSWRDIVAVSAGKEHTVGLKSDGTVVAVGSNEDGQCNVADWTDIVAISAGDAYTVGLRKDGTVVAVGDNYYDQCRVASRWDNIVAISAGNKHVVGLKSDGTVVAAGIKFTGLCDVSDWTNIRLPIDTSSRHASLTIDPNCNHIFEVFNGKKGIETSCRFCGISEQELYDAGMLTTSPPCDCDYEPVMQTNGTPAYECRKCHNIQIMPSASLTMLKKLADTNAKGKTEDVKLGDFYERGEKLTDAIRFWVIDKSGYSNTESIDLYLASSYSTVVGYVFAGDDSDPDTNMTLRFYGDGKLIYELTDITKSNEYHPEIDVTDVKVLKIECTTDAKAFGYCFLQAVAWY